MSNKQGRRGVDARTWMAIWEEWAAGVTIGALAVKYDLKRRTLEKKQRDWRDGHEPTIAVRATLVEKFSRIIVAKAAAAAGVSETTFVRRFWSRNRKQREAAARTVASVIRDMDTAPRVAEMKARRYRVAACDARFAKKLRDMANPPKPVEESELGAYTRESAETPESHLLRREEQRRRPDALRPS